MGGAMAEKRIGLRTTFRGDIANYERWKEEWRIVTKLVRLNAAKAGKDLSEIEITEEGG